MSEPDWDTARAHGERIRELLRKHAGKPEAEEARRAIDMAHAHAHAALGSDGNEPDPNAPAEYSELAWVKTHLGACATPLPKKHPKEVGTIVSGSGGLFGYRKYEKFDPGWQETLVEYLAHIGRRKANFGKGRVIDHDGDLSLSVAGDWATGYWREHTAASKIAALIGPGGKYSADYTIHLGDTYYAATTKQVREHLGAWPSGKRGRLALPGNHEMYTKGKHFFHLLESGDFAQGRTSYFALRTPHWLVLALDSAHDATHMYLKGQLGPPDNPQLRFATRALAERGDRRVLLLTHHAPFDLAREQHREIHHDVMNLFCQAGLERGPDYWAFGHIHAAARYSDYAAPYRARLIGHGAVPFGVARELKGNGYVDWYETHLANDEPHYPDRVTNGFLQLELRGSECRESLIAEDGNVRWHGVF